jgi:hypothetical protein
MSSLNSEQQAHMSGLNQRKRADLCPCGWYSERDCLMHCSTGTRVDAPSLVKRIKEIYAQIDQFTTKAKGADNAKS